MVAKLSDVQSGLTAVTTCKPRNHTKARAASTASADWHPRPCNLQCKYLNSAALRRVRAIHGYACSYQYKTPKPQDLLNYM